jgi:hypothetical protein
VGRIQSKKSQKVQKIPNCIKMFLKVPKSSNNMFQNVPKCFGLFDGDSTHCAGIE